MHLKFNFQVEALGRGVYAVTLNSPSSFVKTPMQLWFRQQRFLLAICSTTLQTHNRRLQSHGLFVLL